MVWASDHSNSVWPVRYCSLAILLFLFASILVLPLFFIGIFHEEKEEEEKISVFLLFRVRSVLLNEFNSLEYSVPFVFCLSLPHCTICYISKSCNKTARMTYTDRLNSHRPCRSDSMKNITYFQELLIHITRNTHTNNNNNNINHFQIRYSIGEFVYFYFRRIT